MTVCAHYTKIKKNFFFSLRNPTKIYVLNADVILAEQGQSVLEIIPHHDEFYGHRHLKVWLYPWIVVDIFFDHK